MREYVANMTDRKSKVRAGVSDDEALVRARQFLADHGIDHAAIIHREDAANFMVEFAALEREFSRQMELARQMMENRRDALRKLADS